MIRKLHCNSNIPVNEGLSILLPAYNQVCVERVITLKRLCDSIPSLNYEIIVADDGSPDLGAVERNSAINSMANCRFIRKERNEGSAATRNRLAELSQYEWLIFLDCDMDIPDQDFIKKYVDKRIQGCVVNGGLNIGGSMEANRRNLRYLYESREASSHTAEQRNRNPYKSFRSTNFMIQRDLFLSIKFEEKMKRYEDVYFGKVLRQKNIKVLHIDNPVVMNDFESNPDYINKIELDARILSTFSDELKGYSHLLTLANTLRRMPPLYYSVRTWHWAFGKAERSILTGSHPCLKLLNIYRIGYFLSNKQY